MAKHGINVLLEIANSFLSRSNILKMLKSKQNTPLLVILVLLSRVCTGDGQTYRGVCTKNSNILSMYKKGYIYNPDYYTSERYVRRTCTWHINTSKGKRIKLEFRRVALRYSRDCIKDYLQVYDGDSTDSNPLTDKLCGYRSGIEPVYSKGQRMTVFFQSMNSVPFEEGSFTLPFNTVDNEYFNVGTMVAVVMGVILVIVNVLVFRYYCRRQQYRRQQQRRQVRHRAQQQTRSENENGRVTEEIGVVGSNVDEPPSYNAVMQNPSQNPRLRDVLEIPPLPPPTYPGTDEPETPPPPYPGVVQQPPQYPSSGGNEQRI